MASNIMKGYMAWSGICVTFGGSVQTPKCWKLRNDKKKLIKEHEDDKKEKMKGIFSIFCRRKKGCENPVIP